MILPQKAIAPNAAMIAAVQPMSNTAKILAPDAITNVEMTLNLNGTDKPITKAFSFLKHTDDSAPYVPNPDTFNDVVSMNIADSQGNEHVFSTYFAKTAVANEWNAYVFIDDRSIDTSIGRNFFVIDANERTSNSTVLPKGEISANPLQVSFNNEGKLFNVEDGHALKAFNVVTNAPLTMSRVFFDNIDLSAINPALTSEPLNIAVDFSNSTQFATPFTVNDLQQTWGLTGTAKNDTIVGLAGNDWIVGNMGADKMTGGLGADTFTFYNAEETGLTAKTRDIITDFKHSEGDKIDVSLMLTEPAMHDFSFIGAKSFSKTDATGELRFDAATHILYGSTDADNKAEFSIQLNGVKSLVANDFILVGDW